MAIDNDKVFDEKTITDILKEYYQKLIEDRDLVDAIIDDMDLKRPLISPFEAEGRAKVLGTLLDARQKTTAGLTNIVNAVARLQGNTIKQQSKESTDWFLEAAEMAAEIEKSKANQIAGTEDDVTDLLEEMRKEKEGNETENSDS
jgi:hypothetical protein